jgi:hypothetical protein
MKSNISTVCARRFRLLELLAEGKDQAEAAEQLRLEGFPAHVRTVRRDVMSFKDQWAELIMTQFERVKKEEKVTA